MLELYRRFGRTYCFELQDRRVGHARKQQAHTSCLIGGNFGAPFDPEDGCSYVLPNDQ
jgi:hypothetical protein